MAKRPRIDDAQLALPGAAAPEVATAPNVAAIEVVLAAVPEVPSHAIPADTPPPVVAAPAAEVPLALIEVAGFRATWLGRLPEATTLRVRLDAVCWYVTTGRELYTALRGAGMPVLSGGEWVALTVAARYGRASKPWLADWLARNVAEPGLVLDVRAALGEVAPDGIEPEYSEHAMTVGRVLRAYGCELDAVAVGDGVGVAWLAEAGGIL
jgi:hypothetical protein